ncbi:MAG: Rieske 2Fe-2S domain-containing protein [Myxococcota bacterium]
MAGRSQELGPAPIARTILDIPLVLFRGEGGAPTALLDRCAHRNVPLSKGWCSGGQLVCAYHGWEYGKDGIVTRVPALAGDQTGKARRAPCFPVREQQGLVWVWMSPDSAPSAEPFVLPHQDDAAYDHVHYQADMQANLHSSLENILDVPHTAFLHRGLFRGGRQNKITAIVRRNAERAEAEYVGEPRPEGWIGRLMAPGGGTVEHFDRFFLPSIAQVEYRLGPANHIVVTNLLTPIQDYLTRMYSTVSFRLRLPHFLVAAGLKPIAKRIVQQDVVMLKAQTEAVQRFGGEQYVSTDVDLLGPHILRLLKQAERGEKEGAPFEERVELLA